MADKIIPDFTELDATPADDDTLLIYDASAGSPRTRSITVANLLSGVDVEAASATSAGIVELATSAETITGTDTARATTPAGVAAAIANVLVGAGSGDVVGPGSSTDNAVARFDSTTGKLIQNSTVTVSDAGDLTASSLALTADLAVTHGGTGASTAGDARTNLGLGTIATQAASAVAITGGTVAGITDIAIADGGTGASTATAAFDALAPTTTQGDTIYHNGTDNVRLAKGTAGQVLTMNGGATAPSWVTPGAVPYSLQTVSAGTGDVAVTGSNAGQKTVIVDVGGGVGTRTLELATGATEGSIIRVFATFTPAASRTLVVRNGDGGTILFSESSDSTTGVCELSFVSDGSDWIVAGPNLIQFETSGWTGSASVEPATDLTGATAPARRYSAASFAGTSADTQVSTWVDISGNSDNATQSVSGERPLTKIIGAFNAVRFDGTNDHLEFTSLTTASASYTVIAVLDANAVTGGTVVGDTVDSSQPLTIGTYGGTQLGISTIDSLGVGASQSGAMTLTTPCVVSVKVTSGVAEFKHNGVVVAVNATTGPIDIVSFGKLGNNFEHTSPYNGWLYDVVIYDSAIEDDSAIINAFMDHYIIS